MTARTALGTTSTKVSGTTLALASITANEGDCLIVMVGGQSANPPTGVTWGGRKLSRVFQRVNATSNHTASIWIARNIVNTDTRTVTATWASSINAKVMAVSKIDVPSIRDDVARNIQTAATAPTSTATGVISVSSSFSVGVLVSEGPSSDTAPTLDNGYTSGQRVGTAGSPPASNITLLEGFKDIVDACAAQTLSGTGATARDWANGVVALRPIKSIAWDKFGDEIEVGDFVLFDGNEREVTAIRYQRNQVVLVTDGTVGATECEVVR